MAARVYKLASRRAPALAVAVATVAQETTKIRLAARERTSLLLRLSLFAVLGFATGVAFVVWYLRRQHARSGHSFDPLGLISAVRLGGMREMGPRILAVPLGQIVRKSRQLLAIPPQTSSDNRMANAGR